MNGTSVCAGISPPGCGSKITIAENPLLAAAVRPETWDAEPAPADAGTGAAVSDAGGTAGVVEHADALATPASKQTAVRACVISRCKRRAKPDPLRFQRCR